MVNNKRQRIGFAIKVGGGNVSVRSVVQDQMAVIQILGGQLSLVIQPLKQRHSTRFLVSFFCPNRLSFSNPVGKFVVSPIGGAYDSGSLNRVDCFVLLAD